MGQLEGKQWRIVADRLAEALTQNTPVARAEGLAAYYAALAQDSQPPDREYVPRP